MDVLGTMAAALEAGEDDRVRELAREALMQGLSSKRVLDEGLIAGMNRIGALFRAHEVFLPDVLLAARAMHAGLEVLRPHLASEHVASRGKVVLGTVLGDLHDIGKNLVGILLGGAGFEVIDLGNDVPPERFVEVAVGAHASVIGMSALLTTTMPVMKRVVELLREQGLLGRVRTIVGGAPVSEAYAREIGADAYGPDAASAVERVERLLPCP